MKGFLLKYCSHNTENRFIVGPDNVLFCRFEWALFSLEILQAVAVKGLINNKNPGCIVCELHTTTPSSSLHPSIHPPTFFHVSRWSSMAERDSIILSWCFFKLRCSSMFWDWSWSKTFCSWCKCWQWIGWMWARMSSAGFPLGRLTWASSDQSLIFFLTHTFLTLWGLLFYIPYTTTWGSRSPPTLPTHTHTHTWFSLG